MQVAMATVSLLQRFSAHACSWWGSSGRGSVWV